MQIASILGLSLALLATACGPNPELGPVRKAVLAWALDRTRSGINPPPDVLVIRLGPGEGRENLGFPGETVFLIGPVREGEFWGLRDPNLRYLFIKQVELAQGSDTTHVEIEVLFGNQIMPMSLDLKKRNGAWEVAQAPAFSS
ncbi:MAG: hypothetical protein HYZ68_05085 [Chloroflexi bacterium]|nr:hypothetical protein [Chloroflexota bacterium]